MWFLTLLAVLLAAGGAQSYYYRHYLSRAFYRKRQSGKQTPQPVSVIVCYRNEGDRLAACIEGILRQDYPSFELLLVDDNSTDNGPAVAAAYDDPRIRHLRPGPTRPGKKDALTYGIHRARHNIILLTDADCVPQSTHWITAMTAPFSGGAELVLGVSPYGGDDRLLHDWQRFEATYTALQYLGFAYRRQPYMGVGRNLAYTRRFFDRAGGLAAHAHLPGGDDDLLVAAAARPRHTKRVLDPKSWTVSPPSDDWRAYFRRKLRHQSVGTAYPATVRNRLLGLGLSHGLFYLSLLLLLVTAGGWVIVPVALAWRWVLLLNVYCDREAVRMRGGRSCRRRLLLFDAALAPFYLFLAVATLLAPRSW